MIRRRVVIVALLAVAAAVSVAGLSWAERGMQGADGPWRPPRIAQLQGVESWRNTFPAWGIWLSKKGADGRCPVLVQDGDILTPAGEGDGKDTVFVYQAGDGLDLAFTFDKTRAILAGKTVSVTLESQGGGWDWLDKATPEELASLRSIHVRDEVEASRLPVLKKLAARNPNVGIALGHKSDLLAVLPLFQPRWLVLGEGGLEKDAVTELARQKRVETLYINMQGVDALSFLSGQSALRKLCLENWDPAKTGPLPDGCERLETLAVHDAGKAEEVKVKDLAVIGSATGLRSLALVGCIIAKDGSALAKFTQLRMLWLDASQMPVAAAVLRQLKELRWLGLPENTTQEQFAAIARECPNLVWLDILKCSGIKDLAPLKPLKDLEGLVLLSENVDLAPVCDLKSLRLLVLPEKVLKEPAEIEALKKSLPETQIIEGSPLCLGSGWILALLPAVGLAYLISSRLRSSRGRPRAQDA
jgi:hypothetical protein